MLIEQYELIHDHRAKASRCDRCNPFTGIFTRHSKTFLYKPLTGSMAYERQG
jgi:hypothetical protein